MQHAPVAASDIPNADVVDDVGSSAVFNQPPRCGLRPPDFNPHDGGWVFFFFFRPEPAGSQDDATKSPAGAKILAQRSKWSADEKMHLLTEYWHCTLTASVRK